MKQGVDYANASSNVYSQASSNYGRTAFTPTFTGFGTPSSVECYHSRDGEFLDMNCSFVAGTTTGVEARVSLPSGLTTTSTPTTRFAAGHYALSSANSFSGEILAQPGQTYITFGQQAVGATATANTQIASTLLSSGTLLTFSARIPIQGWSNASQIVGSFAGYARVPGASTSNTPNVDNFAFSYGTTNATTVCSASPCSYLDQLGSGSVSSVTRTGTGAYTVTFSRTYSKIKCPGTIVARGAANLGFVENVGAALSCSSCSSLSFTTLNTSTTPADTFGTISCLGEY
jgi:hypothetical protein